MTRWTKLFGGAAKTSFNLVKPGKVSKQIGADFFPGHIRLPPTARGNGIPPPAPLNPEIHDEETVSKMRIACRLARKVLTLCGQKLAAGLTTDELDRFVNEECVKNGAYPSPLNYRGFPKSVCTSVNNCVCHGIPDDRPLLDGDIVNVDVTVYINGVHGDCSETFPIGKVDEKGLKLMEAAEKCLYKGVSECGPDVPFAYIGHEIEKCANDQGFNVIPAFTGHGIADYFHGPPDILHFSNSAPGVMKPGMIFTVEPAIGEGGQEIEILEDGWTAMTVDNSRSAQFEHTILITNDGCEVLTH